MTQNRKNDTEYRLLIACLIIWLALIAIAFLWGWAL